MQATLAALNKIQVGPLHRNLLTNHCNTTTVFAQVWDALAGSAVVACGGLKPAASEYGSYSRGHDRGDNESDELSSAATSDDAAAADDASDDTDDDDDDDDAEDDVEDEEDESADFLSAAGGSDSVGSDEGM